MYFQTDLADICRTIIDEDQGIANKGEFFKVTFEGWNKMQ